MNQQQYNALAALQNQASGMYGLGGAIGAGLLNSTAATTATNVSTINSDYWTFRNYVIQPPVPIKPEVKAKGFLAELRAEIDGWHGDVLAA